MDDCLKALESARNINEFLDNLEVFTEVGYFTIDSLRIHYNRYCRDR